MKPVNQVERRRAFWSFLFLFLTTVGIMATSIFFSLEVPLKENDKLRNEIALMDQQRSTVTMLTSKLGETIILLDSVNLPGVQPESIESQIDDNIKNMFTLIRNDSTIGTKSIYNYAIDNCSDLKLAKKQLREVSNHAQAIGSLQQENTELKAQLQSRQNELQQLQMMLFTSKNVR